MRVLFWQNHPSHHQSTVIRHLANSVDVTLVTEEPIPEFRRSMGWETPDFGRAKTVVLKEMTTFKPFTDLCSSDTFHIISGLSAYPNVSRAFRVLARSKARIGIMSESPNQVGIGGRLRFLRDSLTARFRASSVLFALAIGSLAESWYRRLGFPSSAVYPWAYFVEGSIQPETAAVSRGKKNCSWDLLFIGQLIRRKGVDLLFNALHRLRHYDWKLRIVGNGVDKQKLVLLADSLDLSDRILFLDVLPNMEAMKILAMSDLLILPSRWDGWGAVVNEALCRGVPVICSDYCGAADLVQASRAGGVFEAGSVESLFRTLDRQLSLDPPSHDDFGKLLKWSLNISGPVAAGYLLEVLAAVGCGAPRPFPPWRRSNE